MTSFVDLQNPSALDGLAFDCRRELARSHTSPASTNREAVHVFGRRIKDLGLPAPVRDRLVQVLTRADPVRQTRSLYLGLPPQSGHSRDRGAFSRFVKRMADLRSFDSIVALTSLEFEARYAADFIDYGLQQMRFHRASTK